MLLPHFSRTFGQILCCATARDTSFSHLGLSGSLIIEGGAVVGYFRVARCGGAWTLQDVTVNGNHEARSDISTFHDKREHLLLLKGSVTCILVV